MKKYILTSFMSLFLMVGLSAVLTATEVNEKEKKSGCAGAATEQAQSEVDKKSCAGKSAEEKATKASGCTGEAKGTTTSNVSGCAKKCGGDKTKTGSAPGECTKVPSGVGSQRAENR